MKVRNEVLRTMRICCAILGVVIYGTGLVFKIADISVDKSFQGIYWVMFGLTTLYLLVAFWPKPIITRWFDRYYDTLSEAEKERFDREVENAKRERYFLTSKEIVQKGAVITPIAGIETIQYSQWDFRTKNCSERTHLVLLKGDPKNKALVPVNVSSGKKAEELIQAIMERNPEIIREPDNLAGR